MKSRETEVETFLRQIGWAQAGRRPVAGDASNRRYDRLTDAQGRSAILMDAPPDHGEDVRTFVRIAEHLRNAGLSAPEIYHKDAANGFLLIEDFGDDLFADLMAKDPARQIPLYKDAAEVLLHLRDVPKPDLVVADATWLVEMLAPLFDWYAPTADDALTEQFRPFANDVAEGETVLMLRDFHAENLLLLPNRSGIQRVGLLDFQDAMLAHPAYDLVSILQDARRDVSAVIEAEIIDHYLKKTRQDPEAFRRHYAILGLQRNLRILGIFARLCLRDGKSHYVDMIPRVWGYVRRNLAHPALAQLAATVTTSLPEPNTDFLEQLKRRCPSQHTLS